jgi:hypothetical protein
MAFTLNHLEIVMQNFSKRILIENGFNPEFFFNRMYTVNGINYHVSVVDRYRQAYFFNMEQTSDRWRIVNAPKVPDWIMNIEKKLEEAIFESLIK